MGGNGIETGSSGQCRFTAIFLEIRDAWAFLHWAAPLWIETPGSLSFNRKPAGVRVGAVGRPDNACAQTS